MGFYDDVLEAPKRAHGVVWSGDLARIIGLPRRPAKDGTNAQIALANELVKKPYIRCECVNRFGFCLHNLNGIQADTLLELSTAGGGIVSAGTGHGKALALDTPIPTPSGWSTMGDLKVGDFVFGSDGNPCIVTFATETQHNRQCFEVVFNDGSRIIADADHRWLTMDRNQRRQLDRGAKTNNKATIRTTAEIKETLICRDSKNHSIEIAAALQLPDVKLPLDPYLLGVWLGDGTSKSGEITSMDSYVLSAFTEAGFKKGHSRASGAATTQYFYKLGAALKALGVLENKHIPAIYLRASENQRLALLQGLLDSDGYVAADGYVEFCNTNKNLADGVFELATSLGQKAKMYTCDATLYGRYIGKKYRVCWSATREVFRLPRHIKRLKLDRYKQSQIKSRRYISEVNEINSVPVKCITVDSPDHTYLCGKAMIVTHNTGISLLLPTVMKSRVAVLLIPPNLKPQLLGRDYLQWSVHFHTPRLPHHEKDDRPLLHIVTYSELSQAKNSDLLARLNPDLIIADEAHNLKDRKAARTKRFLRQFKLSNPRFVALSGTLTSKSLRDYAHLSELALGEGSPLPKHYPTLEDWCQAIDPVAFPIAPGALSKLDNTSDDVRTKFRRRFKETPGVISTNESALGASLVIQERTAEPLPQGVLEALAETRRSWVRPDGEELVDILEFATVCRELACGFYYRWTFPRGETKELVDEWLEVRANYHKELREKLKRAGPGADSPLLLWQAAQRAFDGYKGPLPVWKSEFWEQWRDIKDTVDPVTEPVWVSTWLVDNAADWCAKNKGIAWFQHRCFGEELAKLSGAPLYAGGLKDSTAILAEKGKRSIVASIRAHGTGKNLQMFDANLVCNVPSDGAAWEQMIARTHRPGQMSDEVTVEVYAHTEEVRSALDAAREKARYIQETTGNAQKLCIASYTW